MKFIRNKLTGKIVYSESPHTDMTIKNASAGETPIEDLEIVDEPDWTDQKYTDEINLQKPYDEKRRKAYLSIGDQLDMQYRDLINGTTEWKDHIAKVKSDIAKE